MPKTETATSPTGERGILPNTANKEETAASASGFASPSARSQTAPRIEKIADALASHIATKGNAHFVERRLVKEALIEFAKEIKLAALEGEFRL